MTRPLSGDSTAQYRGHCLTNEMIPSAATVESDPSLYQDIIAIDLATNGIYPIGKLEAHKRNILHKAISIFVFRGQRLLLQKRADNKYHSGGLWTNSVCSHPRWNERSAACAKRRLGEELGWTVPLQHFGQIGYSAKVGDLYENEQVQCFYGHTTQHCDLKLFNRREVSAVEWLSLSEIAERIRQRPECFTEWFKIYMAEHQHMIRAVLNQDTQTS